MRIAQVSPLYESVPPKLYGGTERVVSLPDRGAGRPGPRGHAVRERRLDDARPTRAVCADGAAAGPRVPIRSPTTSRCSRRCSRAPPTSTSSTSTSTTCISAGAAAAVPARDHAARPAGHAGARAALPKYPDMPLVSISDAQREPLPRRELAGDRLPRPAAGPVHARPGARAATWRSSAGSRPRSASIARSRSRARRACR